MHLQLFGLFEENIWMTREVNEILIVPCTKPLLITYINSFSFLFNVVMRPVGDVIAVALTKANIESKTSNVYK